MLEDRLASPHNKRLARFRKDMILFLVKIPRTPQEPKKQPMIYANFNCVIMCRKEVQR